MLSRRDFLKTAAMAAAGLLAAGFKVEEPEPTEAEQRYAAMLSREQVSLTDQAKRDALDRHVCSLSNACGIEIYVGHGHWLDISLIGTVESVNDDGSVNVRLGDFDPNRPTLDDGERHHFVWRWGDFGDQYTIDDCHVGWLTMTQTEQEFVTEMKQLYSPIITEPEGTIYMQASCSDRFETNIPHLEAPIDNFPRFDWDWREDDDCEAVFRSEYERCSAHFADVGIVESVNDDGSVNVRVGDIVPAWMAGNGWRWAVGEDGALIIHSRPTYEPSELTFKLDVHGVRTDGTG